MKRLKVIRDVATAGLFEDADIKLHDRVIINDGSASNPKFLAGTVKRVDRDTKRILVKLDVGGEADEVVNNFATGLVGFIRDKRIFRKELEGALLPTLLDKQRWICKAYTSHMNQVVKNVSYQPLKVRKLTDPTLNEMTRMANVIIEEFEQNGQGAATKMLNFFVNRNKLADWVRIAIKEQVRAECEDYK